MRERRSSARVQVDLPVLCFVDGFSHGCRAVDLSPTGMVIDRRKSLVERELSWVSAFELQRLGPRPIRFRARPVRADGRLLAVKFVAMNDADRLTIAEHMDRAAAWPGALH